MLDFYLQEPAGIQKYDLPPTWNARTFVLASHFLACADQTTVCAASARNTHYLYHDSCIVQTYNVQFGIYPGVITVPPPTPPQIKTVTMQEYFICFKYFYPAFPHSSQEGPQSELNLQLK